MTAQRGGRNQCGIKRKRHNAGGAEMTHLTTSCVSKHDSNEECVPTKIEVGVRSQRHQGSFLSIPCRDKELQSLLPAGYGDVISPDQ